MGCATAEDELIQLKPKLNAICKEENLHEVRYSHPRSRYMNQSAIGIEILSEMFAALLLRYPAVAGFPGVPRTRAVVQSWLNFLVGFFNNLGIENSGK